MFKTIKKYLSICLKFFVLTLLKFYQACISPLFPGCCRFRPTCSEYAVQAFNKHSFKNASILVIKRLAKCHPFGGKGYDPVPDHICKSRVKGK